MNIQNFKEDIIHHILLSYKEDIGDGDHTSLACVDALKTGKVKLLVKEEGVIAGIELTAWIIETLAPEIKMTPLLKDGQKVKYGDIAFFLEGPSQKLLMVERLLLNYMQRMSGIATNTAKFVDKIKDFKAHVLDTRKTTPGLRLIEKWAVKIGGGENHRMGLYDMIMIKDNHVDFAGGIKKAIAKTQDYLSEKHKRLNIEIEVRNFNELNEVLQIGGIHRIMLDNFSPPDTKKAVELIHGSYETESSGGINIDNIREYAACGVDYISVGALTHHINSLDLSLKAV